MKRLERLEKKHLQAILSDIREGKFAIPTFQREFDWGAKDILELIRSIFEDYYIGTLLFWKVSPENMKSLKSEPVYGFEGQSNPNYFVLDGQQRLSAIYYALCSPNKNFPDKKNKCYFFLDVKKLIEGEVEKAFTYEWDSRATKEVLENPELQFSNHKFPLKILGDKNIYLWTKWIDDYREYWVSKDKPEYKGIRDELFKVFNEILQDYEISFVELDKSLEMSKVCDIFTRINSKGIELSIFDILNAAFLPKGIELKEEWRKISSPLIKGLDEDKMKVYLLQTISILKQAYCSPKYLYYLIPGSKRRVKLGPKIVEDILISSKDEFMSLWTDTIKNVELSIKRIMNPREFGAITPRFLPYPSIVPTFTAIDLESKKPEYKDMESNKQKISTWYWSSIFTQNYSSSVESQSASDFMAMKRWFADDKDMIPVVRQARNELRTLDLKKETNQSSAVYKAIFNIMSIKGARDPITLEFPEDYSQIDDHHIVPDSWGKKKRIGNKINSILNKIPISGNTNRNLIRAKLPNEYLKDLLQKSRNKDKVYEMLESHFISREIVDILLRNPFTEADFDEFILERGKLITADIHNLIGGSYEIEYQIKASPDNLWNKYELEIRRKLDSVLIEKHGEDYWDKNVVPQDVRDRVNEKIKKELKLRPDLRDQFKSSIARLDICDIMDYEKIIQKNWDIFEEIFGSSEEVKNQFKNLQVFRNELKHIRNYSEKAPLDELTRKKGELGILWLERILHLEKEVINKEIEHSGGDSEMLYQKLKEKVLTLGKDIDEVQNKYYIAFKRKIGKNRNFISLKLQRDGLKIWIPLDNADPKSLGRNVSNVGHQGTGDYEFIIGSVDDIDYITELAKLSYEKSKEFISKTMNDEEFIKEANNSRKIMRSLKEFLNKEFGTWAKKFSSRKFSINRYLGRAEPYGNVACDYFKWQLKDKTKLQLDFGLWKVENKPFEFYTAIYTYTTSEEFKKKIKEVNVNKKLLDIKFKNYAKNDKNLWMQKELPIKEISEKAITELIKQEMVKIQPVVEEILK